jgi:hypothetical protein
LASVAAAGQAAPAAFSGGAKHVRFDPTLLLATVGATQPEHVAYSARLLKAIPNELRLAIMDRNGGQAVVFALLMSSDAAVHNAQITVITEASPQIAERVAAVETKVKSLERNLYIPMASLAINSLKTMSEEQYRLFESVLKKLIEADNQVDLFEYMLQRMVKRNLELRFSGNAKPDRSIQSIETVANECAIIFSILAWESSESSQQATEVFGKGAACFQGTPMGLIPREQSTLKTLDEALGHLAQLTPPLKKQLLTGCIAIIAFDGVITVNESEYLRAIGDALECPIPPMIAQ